MVINGNYPYHGEYRIIYIIIQSLCCIPDTHVSTILQLKKKIEIPYLKIPFINENYACFIISLKNIRKFVPQCLNKVKENCHWRYLSLPFLFSVNNMRWKHSSPQPSLDPHSCLAYPLRFSCQKQPFHFLPTWPREQHMPWGKVKRWLSGGQLDNMCLKYGYNLTKKFHFWDFILKIQPVRGHVGG